MRIRGWVLAGTVILAACSRPEIERAYVERVITTLSADEMEGRAVFTPGIDRAAEFLRGEFEAIGLDRLPGEDSYLQTFAVYSLSLESRNLVVDGLQVPEERYAVSMSQDTLVWRGRSDAEVVVVGPDDDLLGRFSSLRSGIGNSFVLVDEAHATNFNRIRSSLARPSRTTTPGRGPNAVFLLTSETDVESFELVAAAAIEGRPLANVGGMIPGRRSDEIVLFAGHYDHIGIRRAIDGDSIGNGANDNASGTAGVVALARYFAAMGRPERTLMFVAFTAEESGGYGSRYFASRVDPDRIVAMFNIEMIGKPAVEGPNTAWITGFERSDFGEILQRAVEGTVFSFYPDPYPTQNLFFRSDNATLARLGVPAHSISTTPIDVDPDYHQVSDEVETLDMEHLTNTIRAIAAGAVSIVDGSETPARVDLTEGN